MNKKLMALIIASTISSISFACSKPEVPELPDAATAVLAQMIKAQKDIKSYLKDGNDYLACEKNTKRYDAAVDEMKSAGDKFNALVRDYKARS
ncbi:MAG: hypothetical protein WCY88_02680 [Spongiibacteraceae bacterium]